MLCNCYKGFVVMKRIENHEWQCPKCGKIVWEKIPKEKEQNK